MQRLTWLLSKVTKPFLNKPFFYNCCISSGLLAIGDVIQQQHEILKQRQNNFDQKRIAKMGLAGLAVGAYCHHFYVFLDRILPGRDVKTLIKKVVVDNLQAPFQFAILFAVLAFVGGQTMQEYRNDLWSKGGHLYLVSSCIYVPAQFLNFYFLSPQFRVLFVSVLNLCFDTYSSYVAHND